MNSAPESLPIICGILPAGPLGTIGQLSIRSFLDNGHRYRLYSYDTAISDLPDGAELLDARTLLPAGDRMLRDAELPTVQIRHWLIWELLARQPDWYASLDMICQRPIADRPLAVGFETHSRIGNGILRFPPGHSVLRTLLRRYRHPERCLPHSRDRLAAVFKALLLYNRNILRRCDSDFASHHQLLTFLMLNHRDSLRLCSPADFYPIPRERATMIADRAWPEAEDFLADCDAIRLFDDEWPEGLAAAAHPDSLLQQLLLRYGLKTTLTNA